jgi:hypothetical protein
MLIVIVIFLLTSKFIFEKPFEKKFWRGKKKSVKLLLDYLFSFLDLVNFLIFFWLEDKVGQFFLGVLCLLMMDLLT